MYRVPRLRFSRCLRVCATSRGKSQRDGEGNIYLLGFVLVETRIQPPGFVSTQDGNLCTEEDKPQTTKGVKNESLEMYHC